MKMRGIYRQTAVPDGAGKQIVNSKRHDIHFGMACRFCAPGGLRGERLT